MAKRKYRVLIGPVFGWDTGREFVRDLTEEHAERLISGGYIELIPEPGPEPVPKKAEPAPEPEPQPEPEPDSEPKRRGRARRPLEETEE